MAEPVPPPARRPSRQLQVKLFVTCWAIFVLHFATDIVREHYLAFSLAEDFSFRVDKYVGLNVDIFDVPGYGAHIGNNPGASMLGAIPYALARPIVDPLVRAVNARQAASGQPVTAVYNDPRWRRVEFYRQVRERGLDLQFGLAAVLMQALLMAPVSAFAAVVMLRLLMALGLAARQALLYAFLYALGTPIFFRTAFLNQNVLIAHALLFGFVILWAPSGMRRPSWRGACAVAGTLGGFSLLADYSGGLVLAWLMVYAAWCGFERDRWTGARRAAIWYAAGAALPIALLLFYQWKSFGSPWYPGQQYMPHKQWEDVGYKGVGGPRAELLWLLLFDPRFGLAVTTPILVLSLVEVVRASRDRSWIPRREAMFLVGFSAAFVLFFSAVQYTRLQWVTGIRYVVPVIPALFLLTVPVLLRLPAKLRYALLVLAFAESWCLSMVRATSVVDCVAQVFLGGFQLPWMTVLAKMAPQYFSFMATRSSPLPVFILTAVLLYGLWRYPRHAPVA
ncbi:MAG: hypothetical protein HYX76_14630 [Acidobacteria bacterium]|nr:hypothetical protein [Acidobacteriota bacterium]